MSDRLAVLGLSEVAALLGVSKRTASRYVSRDDFPAPAVELAMGPIWFEEDVKAWLETNPIRRGRPPGRAAR